MKFIACTEYQKRELKLLHPNAADYMALIPNGEYFYWLKRYTLLFDDLCCRFSSVRNVMKDVKQLPLLQGVSKLCGINSDGYLIPRVFKFATLPEGMRDFGVSVITASRLDVIAATVPYTLIKFPNRYKFHDEYLGFLAWDEQHPLKSHGDSYLPFFLNCTGKINDLRLTNNDRLYYNGMEYSNLLPTSYHYANDAYKGLLADLNDRKMLVLPLKFPLSNLKNLIGFENPSWAQVHPLSYFLKEPPDNAVNYLVIRTDNGMMRTWDQVQSDPKLRLELEMSDYWLWQQACLTSSALSHVNMYWTFDHDYPWLIDKRDGKWIPALVVET